MRSYDEIVLFQENQILPAFIINLKKQQLPQLMKCFKFSLFPTKENNFNNNQSDNQNNDNSKSKNHNDEENPLFTLTKEKSSSSFNLLQIDIFLSDSELDFTLVDELNDRKKLRRKVLKKLSEKEEIKSIDYLEDEHNELKDF